jgi:hypothetical protein
MRPIRSRLYVVVPCAAVIAGIVAYVPVARSATPYKTPLKIRPGTYSGTVQMGVDAYVTAVYPATLTGHWTLTIDKAGHVRGAESMQATIPFMPSTGCTVSAHLVGLGLQDASGEVGVQFSDHGTHPGNAGDRRCFRQLVRHAIHIRPDLRR